MKPEIIIESDDDENGFAWRPVRWAALKTLNVITDFEVCGANPGKTSSQILVNESSREVIMLDCHGKVVATGTLQDQTDQDDPCYGWQKNREDDVYSNKLMRRYNENPLSKEYCLDVTPPTEEQMAELRRLYAPWVGE